MLLIVVVLGTITGISNAKEKYIEPLSKQQQQAIVSQIGINGYKRLIKVRCYDSVVVRAKTERWSDGYCAKSYSHLNFSKILRGEL